MEAQARDLPVAFDAQYAAPFFSQTNPPTEATPSMEPEPAASIPGTISLQKLKTHSTLPRAGGPLLRLIPAHARLCHPGPTPRVLLPTGLPRACPSPYTEANIADLLAATEMLLAVTGVRVGEAIRSGPAWTSNLRRGPPFICEGKFGNYGKPAIVSSSALNRLSCKGFGRVGSA